MTGQECTTQELIRRIHESTKNLEHKIEELDYLMTEVLAELRLVKEQKKGKGR